MNEKISEAQQRLVSSRIVPSNPVQALFLIVHAFLLQNGFICIEEQANATPGFAASVRDISMQQLVPASWIRDPVSPSVLYRHRNKPGKQFSLLMVGFDTTIAVTLSQRGGDHYSIEIDQHEHLQELPYAYINLQGLWTRVMATVQQLLPSAPAPTAADRAPVMDPQPLYSPLAAPARGAPSSITSVGRGDLDPFGSQGPLPLPLSSGPSSQFTRPDAGSLVGPDHPMFHGRGGPDSYYEDDEGFGFPQQPFLPGFQPPQPRFDPFGPIVGPNSDVDVGIVGPGAGRGRGRGRGVPARGLFPGEPYPDHLKPPGW